MPGVKLRGRIPGRPGLWEVVYDGETLSSLACIDPAYAEERRAWTSRCGLATSMRTGRRRPRD